jgi:DegV family protein with EDD domain
MKRNIKLLADSTCDLSPELLNEYDIGIIPLYVNFGTNSYRDNVEITTPELYRRVNETGVLPMTSTPTPGDYIAEFKKYIDAGLDVIYIAISSKLSSSYQNACMAVAGLPEGRVRVIDSLNLSTGIGLLVMTAADALEQGLDIDQTCSLVREKTGKVETKFIIDTLDYLHKGGRCTGLELFLSSLLKIHPVIQVADGSMYPAAKIRGGRPQVLNHLIDSVLNKLETIDPKRIFVTHSESERDALWLKNKLLEAHRFEQIIITSAGCVISSHCGPKTVGILYLKK